MNIYFYILPVPILEKMDKSLFSIREICVGGHAFMYIMEPVSSETVGIPLFSESI